MAIKTKSVNGKRDKKSETIIKDLHDEDASEEDEEGDDVDQEGLEKLMKMLDENELDDIAKQQLKALGSTENDDQESDEDEEDEDENMDGEEDDEEDNEDDGEGTSSKSGELEKSNQKEGDDDDEDVENGEEENWEEDGVALDDVESVDEDAIPRQKIQINNKVPFTHLRFDKF